MLAGVSSEWGVESVLEGILACIYPLGALERHMFSLSLTSSICNGG